MDYYTALRRSGKILDAYFEQSKDILHNASKGTIRESILSVLNYYIATGVHGLFNEFRKALDEVEYLIDFRWRFGAAGISLLPCTKRRFFSRSFRPHLWNSVMHAGFRA